MLTLTVLGRSKGKCKYRWGDGGTAGVVLISWSETVDGTVEDVDGTVDDEEEEEEEEEEDEEDEEVVEADAREWPSQCDRSFPSF
jgi:hypothetical protein